MTAVEPTDAVLDAVADALDFYAVQSPSAVARRAKVSTSEARLALKWLVAHQFAAAVGNGAWTKYRGFTASRDLTR